MKPSIEAFLLHRRAAGIGQRSIERYSRELGDWFLWRRRQGLPESVAGVDASEIRAYLDYLRSSHIVGRGERRGKQCLSEWTISGIDKIIRMFLRFVAQEGHLDEQHVARILRRVRAPSIHPEPRAVYESEVIRALLAGCDQTTVIGARDYAIILLLADTGMRVAELCAMQQSQVDPDRRFATIRGKGQRWRNVAWGDETAEALARYMARRPGPADGPFFRGLGSRNAGGQLEPGAVRQMLKRLAKRVGVTLPVGSPAHSFRHTFAHQALDAGLDGLIVQQLLGHADIRTTMVYTRLRPEKLRVYHGRVSGWWSRDDEE